ENLPRQLAARARPYISALQRDLGGLAAGSHIVQPTHTVKAGEVLELDLGGRVVSVRAWRPAHTDNDLTVYDRNTGTLWLGDLLFVEHTPVLDSNITGFLSVMEELRGMQVRRFVPGHGHTDAAWPVALDPQQRYFEVILRETRDAICNRVSLMDAVNQVGHSEQGNWLHFETYHRRNVTTAYTELEWE
ncbi:MAG TPA: MBL fold metallo-hydrolase, partial [Burkholderiales bacterium]|nr:MBL fold metallo-hydrolase [Burkholderiales bacterium]